MEENSGNETPVEESVEAPETPEVAEPVKEVPEAEPTLTGDPIPEPEPEPEVEEPSPYPEELLMEDGKTYNPEAFENYKAKRNEDDKAKDKRINDMRKMVSSKEDYAEDKGEYFQDYAPPEKYAKYFDGDTPDETKEEFSKLTEKLSDKYFDLALNKRQAYEMSSSVLEILEDVGILDTRTKEQVILDKSAWVETQKEKLGPNADNIIREGREFLNNSTKLTPDAKNRLVELMESEGADFVDVVYQLKSAFGSETGGVPSSIASLQGLGTEAELREEYASLPLGSPRREEIMRLRQVHGRSGKLFN